MAGFSFADEHEAEVFYSKVHGRARLRPCEFSANPSSSLDVHSSRLSVAVDILNGIALTDQLPSLFSYVVTGCVLLSYLFSHSLLRYLFFSPFPLFFSLSTL